MTGAIPFPDHRPSTIPSPLDQDPADYHALIDGNGDIWQYAAPAGTRSAGGWLLDHQTAPATLAQIEETTGEATRLFTGPIVATYAVRRAVEAWHWAQETVRRELLAEVFEILTDLREDREDVPEDAAYSDGVHDTAERAMFELRTRFPVAVPPVN